jgi:polysaccharide deacetylase family protein (PEP-CTERM system associated)
LSTSATPLINALTIDVEDYFQVSAFAPYIRRSEWDTRECRVERNVGRILDMLAEQNTHATFFTLGWIAQRYPHLVRRIAEAGHEVASHGYGHERVSDLTPEDFAQDIRAAKHLLEDLCRGGGHGLPGPQFFDRAG